MVLPLLAIVVLYKRESVTCCSFVLWAELVKDIRMMWCLFYLWFRIDDGILEFSCGSVCLDRAVCRGRVMLGWDSLWLLHMICFFLAQWIHSMVPMGSYTCWTCWIVLSCVSLFIFGYIRVVLVGFRLRCMCLGGVWCGLLVGWVVMSFHMFLTSLLVLWRFGTRFYLIWSYFTGTKFGNMHLL